MGNYVTKFISHNDDTTKPKTQVEIHVQASADQKDIYTPPNAKTNLSIDPRSVTTGIDRTPISSQVNDTPVASNPKVMTAVPRYLQKKLYLETDLDRVMPLLTPKKPSIPQLRGAVQCQSPEFIKLNNSNQAHFTPTINIGNELKVITPLDMERYKVLGLDPRSPAADFERTPIITLRSIKRIKARSQEIQNRRGSYETDVFYPKFSFCETSSRFAIQEIQSLPDMALQGVKSLKSFDFACDNDMNKSCSYIEALSENEADDTVLNLSFGNLGGINEACAASSAAVDCKKRHGTANEIKMIDHQSTDNTEEASEELSKNEIRNDDNLKIRVWRDSTSSEDFEDIPRAQKDNKDITKITQIVKEEVNITFVDHTVTKDTQSLKIAKVQNDSQKKAGTTEKKRSLKSDFRVLSDEKKVFGSENKTASGPAKTRTPLGNRFNNGQMSVLATNSPQQMFRNKGMIMNTQENTPPHRRYTPKSKQNGIQWDPDSTVVI